MYFTHTLGIFDLSADVIFINVWISLWYRKEIFIIGWSAEKVAKLWEVCILESNTDKIVKLINRLCKVLTDHDNQKC